MSRTLTFSTVPKPVFEAAGLRDQASSQAIAVLLIETLEDAQLVLEHGTDFEDLTAERLLDWAQDMRDDMRDHWKEDLLMGLGKNGFLMNTHCGFFVQPLAEKQVPSLAAIALYAEIEKMAKQIASGELPVLEDEDMVAALVGTHPEVYGHPVTFTENEVEKALSNEGKLLLLMACIEHLKAGHST